MAFADPQSVTVATVAQSLPRTSTNGTSSTYTKDDGSYQLVVSHSYGKRTRRTVRLNTKKVAADPFLTGVNQQFTDSVYLVVDHPSVGFSVTELKDQIIALADWLKASTNANTIKLLGGES